MKKIIILTIVFVSIFLNGCTEVVDVDLKTDNPKLVIEAFLEWEKGTTGANQKIKLTTTTNFYTNTIPVVSNATVTIKNSTNTVFNFIENPGTGIYNCTNFVPVLNETYTLTINYNGQVYQAQETMKALTPIINIEQNNTGGIAGNDIQIKTIFDDPAGQENFYLFSYTYPNILKPDIYVTDDVFFDGNPFFSSSFNDDLKAGDIIKLSHTAISKQHYNFLNVLLTIAGSGGGGGPFQAPPVTVRGNILNVTNQDNFPFGYFNLSEKESKTYTIL